MRFNLSSKMFIFLCFLTILSYNIHHPFVEARTQLDDGFSIDLIHKYSPKSPLYNSSMTLKERFTRLVIDSKSRHNRIITLLQNQKIDSALSTNEGDYLMNIDIGSPPVKVIAVFDTSTDLTWFQCKPCLDCYQQNIPIFDPEQSSTYKFLPCDSQHCSSLDTENISCNQNTNQCIYMYTYGNMTSITIGIMGNDTFSFTSIDGNNSTFPDTVFGCGFEQSGSFDPASSGVVGLGNGPVSLVSQLGYETDYKFSYCLASVTSNSTSKLTFGAVETEQQGVVETPFATKITQSYYSVELKAISIGRVSIEVDNDIIIDSATTLTYVSPSIFASLEDMVNEVIGVKPMHNSVVEGVLCYQAISGVLSPPDIVFHFSGGDLRLKGMNIFFELEGSLCLSIVPTPKDDDPLIFGNMAQVNLQVEFDLLNKTVSFSPKDCAHDN